MRDTKAGTTARRRRAVVLILALPAGLLAAEGLVRAVDLRAMPLPETEGTTFRPVDDPVQRFENRPGATQKVTYRGRPGAAPHVVTMRVNADGFRGPRVVPTKPAGTLRLACLGDSHTFGHGVEEEETWPAHLRRILADRGGPSSVEVINAGVSAYDTPQERRHLERAVLPLDPDVVILQYYVNDTAIRGVEGAPPDPIVALAHPRRGGAVETLRRWSRLADVALDRVYRRRSLTVYASERLANYEEESAGWRAVAEALTEIRDLLAARDVRFVVALFPFLVRDGGHLTSHEAFERVKRFLAAEGIDFLDPEAAFLDAEVDALRISDQDYHANGEGYRLFAREVAEGLVRRGWLEPERRR
ncbi:MAG: SGNH/GDSL hydrolase family protein [Planctomycetota bacterium JB042]